MSGPVFRPARPQHASVDPSWRNARLAEARAVIADVAHHSDHLVRMACEVVIRHGKTAAERDGARVLLLVVDVRRPLRHAQRDAQRCHGSAGTHDDDRHRARPAGDTGDRA